MPIDSYAPVLAALHLVAHHPAMLLYALLALIYAVAARIYRRSAHAGLANVYAASSALHGLLCLCHALPLA